MATSAKRRAMHAAAGINTAIPNGAGYPLAFTSQGVNLAPVGYNDPSGYQFAAGQLDGFYTDGDPFGGFSAASGYSSSGTSQGLNGFADLYGTTLSNQNTVPLTTPSGVTRTQAVRLANQAQQEQYEKLALFLAVLVGGAYYLYRRRKG